LRDEVGAAVGKGGTDGWERDGVEGGRTMRRGRMVVKKLRS